MHRAANVDQAQWARLGFSINADSASVRHYLIDNIRTNGIVPEPASLAALGLGRAVLIRRKK